MKLKIGLFAAIAALFCFNYNIVAASELTGKATLQHKTTAKPTGVKPVGTQPGATKDEIDGLPCVYGAHPTTTTTRKCEPINRGRSKECCTYTNTYVCSGEGQWTQQTSKKSDCMTVPNKQILDRLGSGRDSNLGR